MIFADMHCDTITELYKKVKNGSNETIRKNTLHIDLYKLKEADYLLQNFAVFINRGKSKELFKDCIRNIEFYYKEMEKNKDIILPVTTFEQIRNNIKKGKMSALLTVEEGGVLEGSIENLHKLYRLGVRMITLTWNYENELGFPNFDIKKYNESGCSKPDFHIANKEQGLTTTGIYILEEMQRLGMIVDVSHGSDKLFYDVCHNSKKPFVASHSNARKICNNCRNLSDDMIKELANHGGVMGLNFCADFLNEHSNGMCYIEDIVQHMKHIKKVGGTDVIGLGTDFDGIENELEMKDASGMMLLFDEMLRNDFNSSEIEKIFSKNVLRVYKEVLM